MAAKRKERSGRKKRVKKISLEQAVYTVTKDASVPLSLEEIGHAVTPLIRRMSQEDMEDDIYEIMSHNPYFFEFFDDEDDRDMQFDPRGPFFKGKSFRICPTEHELNLGVLFAGHRFVPFFNIADLMPTDCVLRMNGADVSKKVIDVPLSELHIYHTLLGMEAFSVIFDAQELPANMNQLQSDPDVAVRIEVYDMKAIYSESKMKAGGVLTATVQDWMSGVFDLSVTSSAEMDRDFASIRKWCDALDNALEDVFDEYDSELEPVEQLALAFFIGDSCLMETAGLHIGGYLGASKRVSIQQCGLNTVLWYADRNASEDIGENVQDAAFMLPGEPGKEKTLDDLFQYLGLDISQGLFEAYMRDELIHGKKSLKDVMTRILDGRELIFYSEEQKERFFMLTEELWDEVSKSTSDPSVEFSEYRSRCLDINDRIVRFIRSLDRRGLMPHDLPMEQMIAFGQFSQMVSGLIEKLNFPEEDGEPFVPDFILLTQMDQTVHNMIDEVEGLLP